MSNAMNNDEILNVFKALKISEKQERERVLSQGRVYGKTEKGNIVTIRADSVSS